MAETDLDAASGGELSVTLENLARHTQRLEIGAGGLARAITQAFRSAVVDGKRFEDVLKSLALRLSDLSLRLALKPLERTLAGGIEGLVANLSGGGKLAPAGGGLVEQTARVTPFADGGVIAAPRYFPIGRGRLGLAGEAGPEAILPLARGADGRLGVAASGAASSTTVSIHIATPDAESFRRSETYVAGLIARAVARGQRGL